MKKTNTATTKKQPEVITKIYHGKTHEVRPTAEGFEYRGKVYPTLTAIAMLITAKAGHHARRSGPAFFGLEPTSTRKVAPATKPAKKPARTLSAKPRTVRVGVDAEKPRPIAVPQELKATTKVLVRLEVTRALIHVQRALEKPETRDMLIKGILGLLKKAAA